jgi:hypothetical protein
MTNLGRRLKKLEARITDRFGLMRGSPAWVEYRRTVADRLSNGEAPETRERIPIEFVDSILAEALQANTSLWETK